MKNQFWFIYFFLITFPILAQSWTRTEIRDNWGEIKKYIYVQNVICTGLGSSGQGTWNLQIRFDPKEKAISFFISPISSDGLTPFWLIVPTDVTISLRNNNNTQSFFGIGQSPNSSLDNVAIISTTGKLIDILYEKASYNTDQELINALKRNIDYTILIEVWNNTRYVRAYIKGNMPVQP